METSTWATAGSCQGYFGQYSQPDVSKYHQLNGAKGQPYWNPTTNYQQYFPIQSATQAPQGQYPGGAYATEQLSNQNASSKWVTTSTQVGHTNGNSFLRTPSMLEKANSQNTCVYKAHGNQPLPSDGTFLRQQIEDFRTQPVYSRALPQLSPSVINTQQGTNVDCIRGPRHSGQQRVQQVRRGENPNATPATTIGHGNVKIHPTKNIKTKFSLLMQMLLPDSQLQIPSPVISTACLGSVPSIEQKMCPPQTQPASSVSNRQSVRSAVGGQSMQTSQTFHHKPFKTDNGRHHVLARKQGPSQRQKAPKPSTIQQPQTNPASYLSFQNTTNPVAHGMMVGLQHNPQMHHAFGHTAQNQTCTENAEPIGHTQRNVQFAKQDEALPSYKMAIKERSVASKTNVYSLPPEQIKPNAALLHVTNSQSGNEFTAQNFNFEGFKPLENNQWQQQQGPSACNESQTMNAHELVSLKNSNFQQYTASGSNAQHGQKAIAVVQPLSTEQQVMGTDTLTRKTPQKTTDTANAFELFKQNVTTNGQHTLSPAQGQEGVTGSGSEEMDCVGTSPEEVVDVSSIQTVPWTLENCTALLKLYHNSLKRESAIEKDVSNTLINCFWGGNYDKLLFLSKSDYYKSFITAIAKACSCADSTHVIFSQVHPKHMSRLKEKFHILGHGAVHSEEVYKSSWLNINEKLDDIDKDFGFPRCLQRIQPTCQIEKHPELKHTEERGTEETVTSEQAHGETQDAVMVLPVNVPPRPESQDAVMVLPENVPPRPESQDPVMVLPVNVPPRPESQDPVMVLPVKVSPRPESQDAVTVLPVNVPPRPESQDPVMVLPENVPPRPVSQDANEIQESDSRTDTRLHDEVEHSKDCNSSDPFMSMEIHVLAPEEAKELFECVQVKSEVKADKEQENGSLPEGPTKEESSENVDVEVTDWTSQKKEEGQIEMFCCLSKLVSQMCGQKNTCQCENNLGLARPLLDNNHVETHNTPVCSVLTEKESNIGVDLDEDLETHVKSQSSSSLSGAPVVDLTLSSSDDDDYNVLVTPLNGQEVQALQTYPQIHANEDTAGTNPVELGDILKLQLSEKVEIPSNEKRHCPASLSLKQKQESISAERKSEDKGQKKRVGRKKKVGRKRKLYVENSELVPRKKSKRVLTDGVSLFLKPSQPENRLFKDCQVDKSKPKWPREVHPIEVNSSEKLTGPVGANSNLQGSMITLALFGSSQNKHEVGQTRQSKDKCTRHYDFSIRALVPPQTLTLSSRSPKHRSPVKERLYRDWENSFVPAGGKKRGRPCKVKKLEQDIKEPTQTPPLPMEGCPPMVSRGKPQGGSGGMKPSLTDTKKATIFDRLKLRVEKSKICAKKFNRFEETKNSVFNPAKGGSVLNFASLPKTFTFKKLEPQNTTN